MVTSLTDTLQNWGDGDSTNQQSAYWGASAVSACDCANLAGKDATSRFYFVWDGNSNVSIPPFCKILFLLLIFVSFVIEMLPQRAPRSRETGRCFST